MATIKCCRGCPKRAVGCHSVCEQYIEEKKKWESVLLQKRKEYLMDSVESDRILKIEKSVRNLKRHRRGY